MSLRIGSLCTGYGGLDLATEAVFGATTAWVSDIDKGACKIIAHRFPDVPNLGDMTTVDWSQVEPVDIITGGTPCQDLSHAGKRAGMTEGTRSNLWVAMREAIAELRPTYVIWENVRGAYSAAADSGVVVGGRLLGPPDGGPTLRALGRVLGDLSDLGYDAQWRGLRAADVGAPHGRFRVFVVAQNTDVATRGEWRFAAPGEEVGGRTWSDAGRPGGARTDLALLPTPTGQDGANNGGPSQFDRNSLPLNAVVSLLPTPAVNDMGAGKTVEAWDDWTTKMQAAHGNGNGHGKSLHIEAARLLPTPSVADAEGGRKARSGERSDELLLNGLAAAERFGDYAPAIARWEQVLGRPAPDPTEPTGRNGAHRLSARFTEWMMGVPDGWITDTPGLTRNEALKACGNGVVPQQAYAAIVDSLGAFA